MRRYFLSHHLVGSRFCISLLAFASLVRETASRVFFVLLISLGHMLKKDVVKLMHMHRRHNPGVQHLTCAVYITINPLSYNALTSTPALYSPAWSASLPLRMRLCTFILVHSYLKNALSINVTILSILLWHDTFTLNSLLWVIYMQRYNDQMQQGASKASHPACKDKTNTKMQLTWC